MSSIEETEQELINDEWEQTRQWFNVTHQEGYDKTIHTASSNRLDILMDAIIEPENFKALDGYKDLDSVQSMTDRARGEIAAWKVVFQWKDTAAVGFQTLQEQQVSEEDMEDESPFASETWADKR